MTLLYFTRRISIVTAVRFVTVDFKEMNEWMDLCRDEINDLVVRCFQAILCAIEVMKPGLVYSYKS